MAKMRQDDEDKWVFSEDIAHPPIIDADTSAKRYLVGDSGSVAVHGRPATRPRGLPGLTSCAAGCTAASAIRLQGQYNHGVAYYRCCYPKEYALAAHVRHPGNVYLREPDVVAAIDRWLPATFAPHRLDQTIREIEAAQPPATAPA